MGPNMGGLSDVRGRDFLGVQQIRREHTKLRRATCTANGFVHVCLYLRIPQKSHGIFDVCPWKITVIFRPNHNEQLLAASNDYIMILIKIMANIWLYGNVVVVYIVYRYSHVQCSEPPSLPRMRHISVEAPREANLFLRRFKANNVVNPIP